MTCFMEILRRTASDKILRDKVFNKDKNPMMDIKEVLLRWFSMVYKFFDKELLVVVLKMRICLIKN